MPSLSEVRCVDLSVVSPAPKCFNPRDGIRSFLTFSSHAETDPIRILLASAAHLYYFRCTFVAGFKKAAFHMRRDASSYERLLLIEISSFLSPMFSACSTDTHTGRAPTSQKKPYRKCDVRPQRSLPRPKCFNPRDGIRSFLTFSSHALPSELLASAANYFGTFVAGFKKECLSYEARLSSYERLLLIEIPSFFPMRMLN